MFYKHVAFYQNEKNWKEGKPTVTTEWIVCYRWKKESRKQFLELNLADI